MGHAQNRHWQIGAGVVFFAVLNTGCGTPAAGALQITPAELALGRDRAGTIRLVDSNGETPENVYWKSGDPSIADVVEENGEVRILARKPGRTCIDAIRLWEFAKTCVTVLETPSLPDGHLRWIVNAAAVLPSAQIADVIPARGDHGPSGVAMFVVERDYGIENVSRMRVTLRGLDADGRERWRQSIDNVGYEMGFADANGGVVIVFPSEKLRGACTLVRFDGDQGIESWRYVARGDMPAHGAYAVREDGTIFMAEEITSAEDEWSLLGMELIGLDGRTGKVASRLPLPLSTTSKTDKVTKDEAALSNMVVEADGTVAVAISPRSQDWDAKRVRDEVKLLRVATNGDAAWQTIRQKDRDRWFSGDYRVLALTSNGQGALLVTWSESDKPFHALASRTHVSDWEFKGFFAAIDGLGNGYGITREGDVARIDPTTGTSLGETIRLGEGATVLSGRGEGGVIVRDGEGRVHEYSADGATLKTLQMPSNGQHPWRPMMIGKDLVETEGANIFAYRIVS